MSARLSYEARDLFGMEEESAANSDGTKRALFDPASHCVWADAQHLCDR